MYTLYLIVLLYLHILRSTCGRVDLHTLLRSYAIVNIDISFDENSTDHFRDRGFSRGSLIFLLQARKRCEREG